MFGLALGVLYGGAGLLAVLLPLFGAAAGRSRAGAVAAAAGTLVVLVALPAVTGYIWGRDGVWAASLVPYGAAIVLLAGATTRILRTRAGGLPRWVRRTAGAAGVLAVAGLAIGANRPPAAGQLALVAAALLGAGLLLRPRPVPVRGVRIAAGALTLAAVVALVGWRSADSRLPGSYAIGAHDHLTGGLPVTALVAGPTGAPVKEFTVTASGGAGRWRLEPAELRVTVGDRLRVTLVNRLDQPTALHWHGVPVPASQDGVPGLTQDAVRPGDTFRYEFDAVETGTYWYHAHQDSFRQVARGLYGALVVEPARGVPEAVDRAVLVHSFADDTPTLADPAGGASAPAAPGQSVRLRVVNTDDDPHPVTLTGAAFRVAALDGHDLHEPGELRGAPVEVPAGGRADLTYVQPATQVRLAVGTAAYTTGTGPAPAAERSAAAFDLTAYGTPDPAARPPGTPTVRFTATVTTRIGWYDGGFGVRNEINGALFPNGDMLMVRPGDVVEVTVVNRSFQVHPMHLHGHTFSLVRSGGRAVTGSPVRLDTTDVRPGESTTIVFRADNPGLWMFHCHNLRHAAAGMDLMIGYEGVGTPFRAGRDAGNDPE